MNMHEPAGVILGISTIIHGSQPNHLAKLNVIEGHPVLSSITTETIDQALIVTVGEMSRIQTTQVSKEIHMALHRALKENRILHDKKERKKINTVETVLAFLENHGFKVRTNPMGDITEIDYPSLAKALEQSGIPVNYIGAGIGHNMHYSWAI